MSRPFSRLVRACFFCAAISLLPVIAQSQTLDTPTRKSKIPPARRQYMGRTIARTMHYTGAPWLLRESREREEASSEMLTQLKLQPGQVVCDLGCGNGFYALRMAKQVGADGQVYGVDIQPEMLVMLRQRCEEQGITNVTPVLGSVHNPRLPKSSVDLILLVDVYHEFSHPELMLRAMRRALKPQGKVALLEYRAEDPDVPIKPLHKMTKEQALREFRANGFRLHREYNKLPWQHMMFFEIDPDWVDPRAN